MVHLTWGKKKKSWMGNCSSKQTLIGMADFFFLPPRGQSPMHILGQYGKDNAAAICDLFLECMPEYPLDKPDAEGNTGR